MKKLSSTTVVRLLKAIERDVVAKVRSVIAKQHDLEQTLREKSGLAFTALEWAVCFGAAQTAKYLIELGANVNSTRGVFPPLIQACSHHHPQIVRLLLAHGADPNVRTRRAYPDGEKGETALMFAAHWGDRQVVKDLLEQGANVNETTKQGRNAVSFALGGRDRAALVSDLFRAGAAPPRNVLLFADCQDLALVRLLIRAGADVNATTPFDPRIQTQHRTVLGSAIVAKHFGKDPRGLQVIRELLKAGANVNQPNILRTPLNWAVFYGEGDVVRLLLQAGADTSGYCFITQQGLRKRFKHLAGTVARTALHEAAQGGHVEIFQMLIEAGADAHARDVDGLTPIEVAAKFQHDEIIKLLAKPVARNSVSIQTYS